VLHAHKGAVLAPCGEEGEEGEEGRRGGRGLKKRGSPIGTHSPLAPAPRHPGRPRRAVTAFSACRWGATEGGAARSKKKAAHARSPRPPPLFQPDAVRAVVDAVVAAPDDGLADALDGFTWTFEKVRARGERDRGEGWSPPLHRCRPLPPPSPPCNPLTIQAR
jgi:hypothetical protein